MGHGRDSLEPGIRHAHHLISNTIRFLFIGITWPADAQFGLKGMRAQQPLNSLVTSALLKPQDRLHRCWRRHRMTRNAYSISLPSRFSRCCFGCSLKRHLYYLWTPHFGGGTAASFSFFISLVSPVKYALS